MRFETRFEASLKYASFKGFKIEWAIRFQDQIYSQVSKAAGGPLAKSTISSVLAANKGFIFWLAAQSGYKSCIRHSDADCFNMSDKGARIARTARGSPYPPMKHAHHVFNIMPENTDTDKRNKAIFAFYNAYRCP